MTNLVVLSYCNNLVICQLNHTYISTKCIGKASYHAMKYDKGRRIALMDFQGFTGNMLLCVFHSNLITISMPFV